MDQRSGELGTDDVEVLEIDEIDEAPVGYTGDAAFTDTDLGSVTASSDIYSDSDVDGTRVQIEQTRQEMSETINAIQEKLSPDHLTEQAKSMAYDATVGHAQDMLDTAKDAVYDATVGKATDMVSNAGDTAQGFGARIIETIKENPIPAALAGIGIGWLIAGSRNSSSNSSSTYRGYTPANSGNYYGYQNGGYAGEYRTNYGTGTAGTRSGMTGGYAGEYGTTYATETNSGGPSGVVGKAQDVAGQMSDQVQGVAGQVQDTAGQVVGQVQNTAGQVMDQVQGTTGQLVNQAQYGVQRTQSGFSQLLQDSPLAVGAGALALGIAVGLAIPETDKEDQLLGPARDSLVDQAQHVVQDKVQQAGQVAQQAVGAAVDTAKQATNSSGNNGQ